MQPAQHLVDHINDCILPLSARSVSELRNDSKGAADTNWVLGRLKKFSPGYSGTLRGAHRKYVSRFVLLRVAGHAGPFPVNARDP